MVTQEATYGLSIPGETAAEVSLNGLRAILGQVEAELYRSEIYEKVLSGLRTLPEDMGSQVQRMVKAVSREAIRLALRKLATKRSAEAAHPSLVAAAQTASPSIQSALQSAPKTQHPVPPPPAPNASLSSAMVEGTRVSSSVDSISTTLNSVSVAEGQRIESRASRSNFVISKQPISNKNLKAKPTKKRFTKKELAAQAALQAWHDRLCEIGQQIRQAREGKSWSLYHLHIKTQIPVHQLEALEIGHIERLPEDIYIRGFLRQIGNVLGLDGTNLANSLPPVDPVKAILPTWYQPRLKAGLQLRSVHLYVGYAALMAGGLTWLSHQSAPKQISKPSLIPDATLAPSSQPTDSNSSSGAKALNSGTINSSPKAGVSAPMGIAPPEMNPF